MKPVLKLLIPCLCISMLVFSACNSNADEASSAGNSETAQEQTTQSPSTQAGTSDHSAWTFLTNGYLVNRNTVRVGQDPTKNPDKGNWLDLKPDGTYEYGSPKGLLYTGTWNYDHPSTRLELIPNDKAIKKSQWKVMWNEDNIVFVGTEKYSDNNTQVQYIRHAEKPVSEQ